MNNRTYTIVAVLVVILLVIAGLFFFSKKTAVQDGTPVATSPSDMMATSFDDTVASASASSAATTASPSGSAALKGVKQFTVEAANFTFTPNTITVKQGDTVQITLKSNGGAHDLVVDQYNIATKTVSTGASDTIQFVASRAGTFAFYCSVGNHRQMGMEGKLIVQ